MLLFLQRGLAMFLNLNKKKLKELSKTSLTNSETYQVKGGATTDAPSKTSHARCEIKEVERVTG